MAYSSYSFPSAESITKTFYTYTSTGDSVSRYQGATPTDLAEKAWVHPSYKTEEVAPEPIGGGGISIYSIRT